MSGEGRLDERITAFITSAYPATAPYGDTDGIDSRLLEEPEVSEDGFDYENANYGLVRRDSRMSPDIAVTFLGTSSGGGPTKTRNCSSLVVDMLGDETLWSTYYPSIHITTDRPRFAHAI